jgi:hypothetical protein
MAKQKARQVWETRISAFRASGLSDLSDREASSIGRSHGFGGARQAASVVKDVAANVSFIQTITYSSPHLITRWGQFCAYVK